MRRFSQRSHLVTLSEINITPLLDLAFVLLIIFVITTPLLEQGLNLQLPEGGRPDRAPQSEDVRTIDITPQGRYVYQDQALTLEQIEHLILNEVQTNPNVVVHVRADGSTPWDPVFQLMDLCATHGVPLAPRSQPRAKP